MNSTNFPVFHNASEVLSEGRALINGSLSEFSARFREQLANTELILPSDVDGSILHHGNGRIIKTFRVLALIIRENTERTYNTIYRSLKYYISAAFLTGFAFGITLGVLVQRSIRDRNAFLEVEVRAIREELSEREARRNQRPIPFEPYFGENEDDGIADEFFEAMSALELDDAGDFLTPRGTSSSSSSSLFGVSASASAASLRLPESYPLPSEVAAELDDLAEAALKSCEQGAGSRVFSRCLAYKKKFKRNPDFLWRFARAAYFVSLDLQRGVFVANSSEDGNTDGGVAAAQFFSHTLQTADQFIDLGVAIAKRAIQLVDANISSVATVDRAVSSEDAALAYKWLAILVGVEANNSGINQRIQLGYDFKWLCPEFAVGMRVFSVGTMVQYAVWSYIDTSISLNPDDAYCHFLKGRWCFEVYNLTWIERQFASRLFAAPPSSTIEEALTEFLEVERLQPDHWVVNQVYLAKCEYSRCCYAEAVRWILSAERLLTSENASTLGDAADKDTLVTEIGSLRPQYEAYL